MPLLEAPVGRNPAGASLYLSQNYPMSARIRKIIAQLLICSFIIYTWLSIEYKLATLITTQERLSREIEQQNINNRDVYHFVNSHIPPYRSRQNEP
jgi:uncharacterized SAM-binding protein YcdF (DUF218 family)